MNKEINEIIEQIKTAINFKKFPIPMDYNISIYDMEQLLDYITNLQNKIDKAIEKYENCKEEDWCILALDMYDILRGKE